MTSRSEGEILRIPEIVGLDARRSLIRIPPELDVPLTDRVRKIIDTAAFRRLGGISQLGLVTLVYPGARHTRFEHSLGVYRLALLFLKRLAHDERFAASVYPEDALLLIAAALLHDIGHWPCCHLIEDMSPSGIPPHESIARHFLLEGEIADILRRDWHLDPKEVLCLLEHSQTVRRERESDAELARRQKVFPLLMSILSGPIDIDKMDYLFRDSHGAGVPYGRHFDQERLIGSLCLNAAGDGLAIADKGKTAAELMVFARYVMFSEVYWHHAVRAATVMFQRAFDIVFRINPRDPFLIESALNGSFEQWIALLRGHCSAAKKQLEEGGEPCGADFPSAGDFDDAVRLLDGLFGKTRRIYKRVRQFSILENPTLYRKLAGRPYSELRRFGERITARILQEEQSDGERRLRPNDLLIDAPPVDKEIELEIDVHYPREGVYRPLNDVSPVVRALAREQFDDSVKKVRLYVAPEIAPRLRDLPDLDRILLETEIEGDVA